jgi:hypothetical protein
MAVFSIYFMCCELSSSPARWYIAKEERRAHMVECERERNNFYENKHKLAAREKVVDFQE